MKIDGLIPFNGETIQTRQLKELGYSTSTINKLMSDNLLKRTKRGYYKVNLNIKTDSKLMKYYLMNNLFEEFNEYFDSLPIKDYTAYYYRFLSDIMVNDYAKAYKHLGKCCELNKSKENKINLYAYVLLLCELMNLSSDKLVSLKNKIFDKEDSFNLFLECIIKKDYDNACRNLCVSKYSDNLSKLDIRVLRDLSVKALNCYKHKHSPEMEEYNNLFNKFYDCVIDNNYDDAYFYFNKLYSLSIKIDNKESKLDIIADLFNCFNFIVANQEIDLNNYKTNYKYNSNNLNNFYSALNKNDYINALKFVNLILDKKYNRDMEIYKVLLERIFNFLNIRTIISLRSSQNSQMSLNNLIKEKRYDEALIVANKSDKMDTHDKNMVTSILESLIALEDSSSLNTET